MRSLPRDLHVVALILCACAPDYWSETVARVDAAGIEILTNSGPLPSVPIRSVDSIPVVDIRTEGSDAAVLYDVTMVTPLSGARIAVAVNGSGSVLVFGRDGTLRRTLGRRGEGPGEFRSVQSILHFRGDSLGVYDPMVRRLTIFDGAGVVGRTVDLATLAPAQGWSRILDLSPDLVLFGEAVLNPASSPGTFRRTAPSYRIDRQGQVLAQFPHFPGTETFVAEGLIGILPFGARSYATTFPRTLVVGTADDPELHYYDAEGALTRIVRWPDRAREVTEERMGEYAQSAVTLAPEAQRQTLRERFSRMPYAEVAPAYQGVLASPDGEIWVGDYPGPEFAIPDVRDPSRIWIVVGPDGVIRERVQTPEGFTAHAVSGLELFGVYTDELGVEAIRVYRFER